MSYETVLQKSLNQAYKKGFVEGVNSAKRELRKLISTIKPNVKTPQETIQK